MTEKGLMVKIVHLQNEKKLKMQKASKLKETIVGLMGDIPLLMR